MKLLLIIFVILSISCTDSILKIKKQGMFSAGGSILHSSGTFDVSDYYNSRAGSSLHVDHANVFYQIPEEETQLPMVFLHGYGQSRMGWMTTPDGREGWSNMFLRKGHSVFLIDQPRRGEAGQTSKAGTISTTCSDQTWYTQFRIGTFRNNAFTYNTNSQFPKGDDVLDQFFRQMTPDTAMDNVNNDQNIDVDLVAKSVAAVIDKVYNMTQSNSILVTHSQGGIPGWQTVLYTDHIVGIIAIEPGSAPGVTGDVHDKLKEKKIPISFYYGDYIGTNYTDVPASMMWNYLRSSAYTFHDSYKNDGITCDIFNLPEIGIYGNDHMMFQDLNNDIIANHVEDWINHNFPTKTSNSLSKFININIRKLFSFFCSLLI